MSKMWEILVPCNWNDGTPVRTRHHREWDKRVRRISGGLTILKPGQGQWVDEDSGIVYRDRMIPVRIICTADEMQDIARLTIEHYRQLAVTYYLISEHAFVVTARESQAEEFRVAARWQDPKIDTTPVYFPKVRER